MTRFWPAGAPPLVEIYCVAICCARSDSAALRASPERTSEPFTASARMLAPHDQMRIARIRQDTFVGTGPEVMARIVELKERVGVDEMAVVTWTYDEAIRRQSFAELAKVF